MSGCLYGSVCNNSIPVHPTCTTQGCASPPPPRPPPPAPPALLGKCAEVHQQALAFAGNYTAMLVQMHNMFNGQPGLLGAAIGTMFTLKAQA